MTMINNITEKKVENEMFDTKKYCVCVFLYLYNIYRKKNKKITKSTRIFKFIKLLQQKVTNF